MVPYVTQYCIVVIILVNAKGIFCHVTPFNSKQVTKAALLFQLKGVI